MGAGDGTYVYTSSSSEPTFMGKSAMFDEDVRSVQAPVEERERPSSSPARMLALGIIGLWIVGAICEVVGAHWLAGNGHGRNQALTVCVWIFLGVQIFGFAAHVLRNVKLMKLNFVLLTVVNIALLVTIMWYSFRKPKTKLKHSVYDNSRVRTGVIAVSCAHVVLWVVQGIVCMAHHTVEVLRQRDPALKDDVELSPRNDPA